MIKVNLHTEEYCKFRKLVERTEDGEWASESELMQKCLSADVASWRHVNTNRRSAGPTVEPEGNSASISKQLKPRRMKKWRGEGEEGGEKAIKERKRAQLHN